MGDKSAESAFLCWGVFQRMVGSNIEISVLILPNVWVIYFKETVDMLSDLIIK